MQLPFTLNADVMKAAMAQPGVLCIGVSGGADSVCLLHALAGYNSGALKPRLHALHVNHNLRGTASQADAAFVQAQAAQLGIPCTVHTLAANAAESEASMPTETQLRTARYHALAQQMHTLGSHTLFLAHHQADCAETLLIRLMRGSAHLAAPKPLQHMHTSSGSTHPHLRARPLLHVPKASLVQALQAAKLPWVEDATNAHSGEGAPLRNRLRNEALPLLNAITGGRFTAGSFAAQQLLQEQAQALDVYVSQLLTPANPSWPKIPQGTESSKCGTYPLNVTALVGAPIALARLVADAWLQAAGQGSALRSGAKAQLAGAIEAGSGLVLSAGSSGARIVLGLAGGECMLTLEA